MLSGHRPSGWDLVGAAHKRSTTIPVTELRDCRLYTFIDTAYLAGRDPGIVATHLCEGGADLIQLRAKDLTVDRVRQLASSVQSITSRFGVRLVINDHFEIARQVGAELC